MIVNECLLESRVMRSSTGRCDERSPLKSPKSGTSCIPVAGHFMVGCGEDTGRLGFKLLVER